MHFFQGALNVEQLKKKGDQKFRAKEYDKAASIYSMALDCPITSFEEVAIISEQLFRKRAECFFRMVGYKYTTMSVNQGWGTNAQSTNLTLLISLEVN